MKRKTIKKLLLGVVLKLYLLGRVLPTAYPPFV